MIIIKGKKGRQGKRTRIAVASYHLLGQNTMLKIENFFKKIRNIFNACR